MSFVLSVVIPARNEAPRLPRSLEAIRQFATAAGHRVDVLVVDDGSTDDTAAVAEALAPAFRASGHDLRILRNAHNRGKGFSVRRGVIEARGDVVLMTDADLSAPITEAPKLVEPIVSGQADVTLGSRALDRALIGTRAPLVRDYGGRVFNALVRLSTGLPFWDTQCGFKAFRRDVMLPVFERQRVDRFGFDVEILHVARRRGLRVREIPVVWNDSDVSQVSFLTDGARMVVDLCRIRWNDLTGRYD